MREAASLIVRCTPCRRKPNGHRGSADVAAQQADCEGSERAQGPAEGHEGSHRPTGHPDL